MALARPCAGQRVKGDRQSRGQGGRNGLLQQLRNLRRGLRPQTGVLLPLPISIDPTVSTPEAMLGEYSSQAGRTYQLATPDSLSPTMQAMFARVRKRVADRALIKIRILRKTSPGAIAAGGLHNLLLLDAG